MKNNWISLLALLVSVIALMFSFRVSHVDFKDYWGFVLGLLTLLISILIGWQIYNALEIKEYTKKVQEFGDNIPDLYSCIYFVQAFSRVKHEPFSAFKDYVRSLNLALTVQKSTSKEACIRELNNVVDYIEETDRVNNDCLPEELYRDYIRQKDVIEDCVCKLKMNPHYGYVCSQFNAIEQRFNLIKKEIEKRHDF